MQWVEDEEDKPDPTSRWKDRLYVLYKGDDELAEGTVFEISDATGKSVVSLKYLTYPSYKLRRLSKEGNNSLTMVYLGMVVEYEE